MNLLQLGTHYVGDYRASKHRKRLNFDELTRHSDVPELSLRKAVEWLRSCHRTTAHRGAASGYSFLNGWGLPDVETTGRIAVTLMRYARKTHEAIYADEAILMLDWLRDIQRTDGRVQQPEAAHRVTIPGTSAAMGAWRTAYEMTNDKTYRDSLTAGADYLIALRLDPGRWCERQADRSLHTREALVAAELLQVHHLTGDPDQRHCAMDILDWVLDQQLDNGLYENCSVSSRAHTVSTLGLAETTSGLFEAYLLSHDPCMLDAVRVTSDAVEEWFREQERIPAYFDPDFQDACAYECLAGIAIFAQIWFRLARELGEKQHFESAVRATNLLQFLLSRTRTTATHGALKASHPIWGMRLPCEFPTHATQALADALLERLHEGTGSRG